ncbi:HET-domain-containing protein, partial [Tothia fuscella]
SEPKSNRTDCDDSFDRARQWLTTCLQSHARCRFSANAAQRFPRRLLHVSVVDKVMSVRLCSYTAVPEHVEYFTLSHCWGQTTPLQLTRSKLMDFLKDIPITSLPRTFHDACYIVARLGYQYIWVDSLCILQDSTQDKEEEIGSMGSIFRNSLCTIAALGAKNSSEGCFQDRNPLSLKPCIIRTNGRTFMADNPTRGPMREIQGPDFTGSSRPPLHTRAWVIQERTLSPRTLYYGSKIIFWECISAKASEQKPEMCNLLTEDPEPALDPSFAPRSKNLKRRGMKSTFVTWETYWSQIVGEYIASHMKYDSDKWPAISGLAELLQRQSGQNLMHGLWQNFLYDESLWSAERPGRRLHSERPSWSWLSVD